MEEKQEIDEIATGRCPCDGGIVSAFQLLPLPAGQLGLGRDWHRGKCPSRNQSLDLLGIEKTASL